MFALILSFLISCVLVAFVLPRILILSLRKRLVDPIDPRKVHSVPASRLGGVAFFPAILFSQCLCLSYIELFAPDLIEGSAVDLKFLLEVTAVLSLFLVGIFDDILGVAYRNKFIVQIFAAGAIILSGTYIKTLHGLFGVEEIADYIAIPITIFLYVFVTNAINLIDGIDGLASLLSISALFVYGILLFAAGRLTDSMVAFATLGALLPFCYSNIFGIKRGARSKIFMGDTGALVIGCILGFTAIKTWNISYNIEGAPINHIFFIMAYTMLIIPCFDVARIIIHRYRDRKPLFLPDKNHIHHKFMALGYSPRISLLCILGMNASFMALNIVLAQFINITFIVIIDIVVWTTAHIFISKKMKAVAAQKA